MNNASVYIEMEINEEISSSMAEVSGKGYKPQIRAALELHRRAVPSVEAHHHVNSPNTERNSGGRRKKKAENISFGFVIFLRGRL